MKIKMFICLTITWTLLTSMVMAQNKYALLVGISNYHALDKNNEWNDIHGVNDVNLVSQELKKQRFKIVSLLETQATKENIVLELQKLSKSAVQGSIVYLHFAMHGQPFDDELSMEKSDEEWDESLVPIDALMTYDGKYKGDNHLVDDELNKYTEAIRNRIGRLGMLYVVIDACHAGGASKGTNEITRGTKRGFTNNKRKKFHSSGEHKPYYNLATKSNQSPVIYIEACQGDQINTEMKFNGKYYGPMSYFIGQTICNKQIGKDAGWVEDVKRLMNKKGPQDQNIVIEKSK